ncbi:protein NDNF [Ixodes scapularis]|uniref:protein NDNF n=1 Tax=Ixodes scapularis TaxID=6945 RepID=UPI001A9FA952|nr:protein NDNF [Ixodes scapularis]XP_029849867.2 protein NDNF [Ixodes scapularis]XP_029849868.2 protein NDNF [Ixodes scapularis]
MLWLALLSLFLWGHGTVAVDFRRPPPPKHELRQQFYFPKYRPELFFDNNVVPENAEVSVFVFKDKIRRVFFLVENERNSLLLVASPCSAPIEWHLFRKPLPPSENSDESYGSREQPVDLYRDDGSSTEPVAGGSFYGSGRLSFTRRDAPRGIYMLEFDSDSTDTSVRVYGTSDSDTHYPFPQLPTKAKVDVLQIRNSRVLFTWKASPSEALVDQDVRYCVAINRKGNFDTMCAVESALRGDVPKVPHQDSGFGFWWEKAAHRKMALKTREMMRNVHVQKDVAFECIGRRTWHSFADLEVDQRYFIDVFAINSRTNASSAYLGASVVARNPTNSRIQDNQLVQIVLDQKDAFSSVAKYAVNANVEMIWMFVQSCSGPGPVQLSVTQRKKKILTAEVMETRTLTINHPANGTYVVKISSTVPQLRRVHLLVSKKYHKFPFPTLPDDSSIKVMGSLTTCNSVTLAWKAALDEKVRYCIFKQEMRGSYSGVFAKPQDFCTETKAVEKTGKITCRRYHRFSKHRFGNVIMQKIRKLQPETTYVFEILVTKARGRTLAYEKVWATTQRNCTPSYKGKR